MAQKQSSSPGFTGFGLSALPKSQPDSGVFLLVVYRDGSLTAAAYATERGAMEAAAEYWDAEREEEEETGALEDRLERAQRLLSDEGGILEIIASPVHGS